MKKYYLQIVKYVSLLFLFCAIGFALLVMAYELPTNRIQKNVNTSIGLFKQETTYFSVFGSNVRGTQQDNYTEAIYLSEALTGSQDKGAVHNALSGYEYRIKGNSDPVKGLIGQLTNDSRVVPVQERRFWNGWEVPLKVALQFSTYSDIRYFNFLTQSILLFFVILSLAKKNLYRYAVPFLLAFLFMNPFTIAMTMTFSGFYYEILLSVLVMLWFNDKLKENGWYGYFFALLGMTVFYFNMNYYQLCTVGIPLVLYFILNKADSVKHVFLTCVKYGALWFFGFAGMMFLKWVIYALLVNPDIFTEVFLNATSHMGTSVNADEISRWGAVKNNLKQGFGHLYFLGIEAAFVIYSLKGIRRKKFPDHFELRAEVFLVLLSFIVVIGRYLIEAQHSYIHSWVMYRNLAIVLLAGNVFLAKWNAASSNQEKESQVKLDAHDEGGKL